MGERLTSKWTQTLGEAFGESGRLGTKGELLAKQILESLGFEVTHHPADRELQTGGIDLFVEQHPFDVKANLHTGGDVCFDTKLLKGNAQYIMHVNLTDPNDYIIYPVDAIRPLVDGHPRDKNGCCWFKREVVESLTVQP